MRQFRPAKLVAIQHKSVSYYVLIMCIQIQKCIALAWFMNHEGYDETIFPSWSWAHFIKIVSPYPELRSCYIFVLYTSYRQPGWLWTAGWLWTNFQHLWILSVVQGISGWNVCFLVLWSLSICITSLWNSLYRGQGIGIFFSFWELSTKFHEIRNFLSFSTVYLSLLTSGTLNLAGVSQKHFQAPIWTLHTQNW